MLDDRGEGAWLSDASGQYTFTRAVDPATLPMQVMPPFGRIRPGGPLDLGQAPDGSRLVYIVGDVRTAQCTGGQGELPFTVWVGLHGARRGLSPRCRVPDARLLGR